MGDLLLKNIETLAGILPQGKKILKGKEMSKVESLNNAWLSIKNGKILDFGSMDNGPLETDFKTVRDLSGSMVAPTFCDSHTHVVFASSREKEFVMRIKGKGYEEIAAAGGGILNSAKRLQDTSEDSLFVDALRRVKEMISMGTGAIEIKSGYGLTVEDEIKMLRVVKRIKEATSIPIKATFLGAHAFPMEYKENQDAYVDLIINEMLPIVIKEELAEYVDVFCDRGFFSPEQTDRILQAGIDLGLKAKIHANELGNTGGIQVGVKHKAISVDHLEHCGEEELACLASSNTIPVPLPGTAFFLGLEYPPARKMIDYGLPLALATDFNPGSCPNGNMQFVMSLASIKLRMLPEEAFNSCTINAAAAMELEEEMGSITKGKFASLNVFKPHITIESLPYYFGEDKIQEVYINGELA